MGLSGREKAVLGEMAKVAGETKELRVSARLLANARVVRRYRGKWVGVKEGQVQVAGEDLQELLAKSLERGLVRSEMAMGFIDQEGQIRLV